jgi:integrase
MIIREVFDDQNRLLRLTADTRPHGGQKSIPRCDGCRCARGKVKQSCAARKAAQDHMAAVGETIRKSETYINPKTSPRFYCFNDVDLSQPVSCCLVHQYEQYQAKMVGIKDLLQASMYEKILALKQVAEVQTPSGKVGNIRIGEITIAQIQNYVAPSIWAGRAKVTAQKKFTFFVSVLKWAMLSELMPSALLLKLDRIQKPKKTDVQKRHVRISVTAIEKVIEAATPFYALLFRFQSRTGARPNETTVLQWSDFDFDAKRVYIQRAMNADGVISTPKTEQGIRAIELEDELIQELKAWRIKQPLEQRGNNLVFPTRVGTVQLINNWNKRGLAPAIKRAGVERFTLYGFRHFYASVLLYDLNLTDRKVMRMMGHTEIATTIRNYGHWFADRKDRDNDVREQLNKVFKSA